MCRHLIWHIFTFNSRLPLLRTSALAVWIMHTSSAIGQRWMSAAVQIRRSEKNLVLIDNEICADLLFTAQIAVCPYSLFIVLNLITVRFILYFEHLMTCDSVQRSTIPKQIFNLRNLKPLVIATNPKSTIQTFCIHNSIMDNFLYCICTLKFIFDST